MARLYYFFPEENLKGTTKRAENWNEKVMPMEAKRTPDYTEKKGRKIESTKAESRAETRMQKGKERRKEVTRAG